MHRPDITSLVYHRLFPAPRANDPTSFQAHITRNIVPEVRAETTCFYGSIDCLEAQYPGLDYTKAAHRARLARFTYHRRMFRAFDDLRLTASEIHGICHWEGTKHAREKYEKDHHRLIRDTTWDGIEIEAPRPATAVKTHRHGCQQVPSPGDSIDQNKRTSPLGVEEMENPETHNMIEDDESEDEVPHSYGVELNRHLIAATAARARGEEVVLDADWEQWLKEAAERDMSQTTALPTFAQISSSSNDVGSFGLQLPAIFRPNPQQHVEVLTAPQYPSYSTNTSSEPPTGTAM